MFTKANSNSIFSLSTLKKALFLICAAPLAVIAQEWPNKPITFVVPFPAGGGTDAFARPLANQLTKQLGKQIIIDNRGGAGGTVGASIAAKAAPDGYSFLLAKLTMQSLLRCIQTWITTLRRALFQLQ